ALTLIPMMCARLLRHRPEHEQSRWFRLSERGFQRLVGAYARSLRRVLKHQPLTLLVAVALLGLTVALFVKIPKGLFPLQDTGVILAVSEGPQSISFKAMADRQQRLVSAVV